ncbi:putative quinol monooxygenase [Streptomyces sp. NPDC020607]|uniref:putative quinol monooxygenase n=1 Tax=Streptomyces sp. NPDC020607 TaxID=3365082 RepID=UPI0037A6D58A
MKSVIVVGTAKLRADRADEARKLITSVVERSRREPGCLSHEAHEAVGDPLTLVLIEKWASQQDLDSHNQEPWLAKSLGRLVELLTGAPEIQVFTPLGDGIADQDTPR